MFLCDGFYSVCISLTKIIVGPDKKNSNGTKNRVKNKVKEDREEIKVKKVGVTT